ncbi:WbuC family cupin fold metalloprotein [Lentisphaerota bacterium ZTH]|nr:WbuC family cupin fold metalloprotein [Lentisphaerota bacterium]WET06911.1 WbuC family cupin fold metalloprotein [Lentisphaerota bacterium ZTH]
MKIIDKELMDKLTEEALASERKRSHYNLHASLDEDIHRLCIAAEPGTYVKPHRHLEGNKWELMVVLRGHVSILQYDDDGKVIRRVELQAGEAPAAVEIAADSWHNFVVLKSGSVVMEVKRGPYQRPSAADFASWAPDEGEAAAPAFCKWFEQCTVDSRPEQI